MSFIYSRKLKNKVYVFADSKLTVYPNDENQFIKSVGKYYYDNMDSIGILKNVIINKNICVASAGILENFNELLKYIDDNKITDVEKICEYALKIHNECGMKTDFIVSLSSSLDSKLYEIKNGNISEVESSWLGSYSCFTEFQKLRHDENIKKRLADSMNADAEIDTLIQDIDSFSFNKIVSSGIDDMVGRNIIECIGVDGCFKYKESFASFVEKEQAVLIGEDINLFDNAFDGGYSYHVYESSDYFKIYIYQLGKGIIFEPFLTHEKYNHLRVPKVYDMSESEFLKETGTGDLSISIVFDNFNMKGN